MNLREIDRLVAEKVMGWRLKSFPGGGGGFSAWLNDDGKIMKYENDCTLDAQPYDFWRPTTNIADAWQVVEKFESVDLTKKELGYICWIHDNGGSECNNIPQETAPLAICLAALKTVGVEVE